MNFSPTIRQPRGNRPKRISRPREAAPSGSPSLLGHRHVSPRSHTPFKCLRRRRRSRVWNGTDRGFDACGLVGLLLALCNPWLAEHGRLAPAAPGQRADEHEDTEEPNCRPTHQMISSSFILPSVGRVWSRGHGDSTPDADAYRKDETTRRNERASSTGSSLIVNAVVPCPGRNVLTKAMLVPTT